MGGDGGVIASNRRYMRGAGTADHTGDYARQHGKPDPLVEEKEALLVMTTCAVSDQPLQFERNIVACPYGRLYHKEAAIEALLRRKQQDKDELGGHIRGLKDLHDVRFQLQKKEDGTFVPSCPITGIQLNGRVAAFALVPGKSGEPNVVSERGLKEMGEEALLEEYKPANKKIRLAPSLDALEEIKEELEKERSTQKPSKKTKKSNKKRKRTPEE